MRIMKLTALFMLQALCGVSYANCEASIMEGSHSARTQQEAASGALEDARDRCYPGDTSVMEITCEQDADGGSSLIECKQRVSCTLCGEDLARKYEALD